MGKPGPESDEGVAAGALRFPVCCRCHAGNGFKAFDKIADIFKACLQGSLCDRTVVTSCQKHAGFFDTVMNQEVHEIPAEMLGKIGAEIVCGHT